MNRSNGTLVMEGMKPGLGRWTRVGAGRLGESWELRKGENRETRRINRRIARQIQRGTNRAMDERPGAHWMCYFSGPGFGDVLKTVA